MKIGVAGAGAVGSYFGGKLAQAGHKVIFLARGSHLEAMKKEGLRIQEENGEFNVYESFTSDPRDLWGCALILLCVKSHDTGAMVESLAEITENIPIIMTMQNGVENEEILKQFLPISKLLSSVTYVQTAVESPGCISQQGRVKLVVGDLGTSGKALEVVNMLQNSGIEAAHSSRIMTRKWNKLLWNVTFNPLSAVSGARIGQILENEQLRKTAELICGETVEVAFRKGVDIDPDSVLTEVFSRAEYAKKHQTSMLQDRLRGKRMEVEAMGGYIVKLGIELGVNTPVLQSIYSVADFVNIREH